MINKCCIVQRNDKEIFLESEYSRNYLPTFFQLILWLKFIVLTWNKEKQKISISSRVNNLIMNSHTYLQHFFLIFDQFFTLLANFCQIFMHINFLFPIYGQFQFNFQNYFAMVYKFSAFLRILINFFASFY